PVSEIGEVFRGEPRASQWIVGAGDETELVAIQDVRRSPAEVPQPQRGIGAGPAINVDRQLSGKTGQQRQVDEARVEPSQVHDSTRARVPGPAPGRCT